MKLETIQTSFVGGEFASSLFGRTDIAQYANACAEIENFLIRPFGSIISTPGTEYINACKTGGSTSIVRLLNFIFSRTDSYIIEMGVGYFRFFTDGAVVVSPGTTPYEVTTFTNFTGTSLALPYTASDIFDVQYAQLNDVIYLAHSSYAPKKLTRVSSTSWNVADLPFTGGPFLPDNTTTTTITPSATSGSVTLSASANIFTVSGSTLGHKYTFWAINTLVTNATTGLQERGYVQITTVTNPSTATATVIKTLKATSATTSWAEGAWSDVRGWPARVTFHQQRLCFARTTYQPQNVWCSQPFTYENYAVNGGADDDAIDIQLAATESNQINWLVSGDSLVAGTYGGDFVIKSGDDSPLTPSNTNVFKQTSWGSEATQPKRIGNFFYYIQRFGRKIRELFYIWDLNSYKSIDKTILSPHIAGDGFKEFAYQQNPDTVLWALRTDGTIATLTREIDQEVQGWARQTTDGTYESIASIPSIDEPHDEVWVVVNRTINGSAVRYIERFKSQIVPERQDQCFYVHSGLSYDAFTATTSPTSTTMSFSYPNSVTKLLLHCDGANASTTFTDAAAAKTVTANGSAQISTSIKKFGTGSAYFQNVLGNDSSTKLLLHLDNNVTDSSSGAKTVTNSSVTFSSSISVFGGYSAFFDGVSANLTTADHADFNFGSGDFTIDTRVNFSTISATQAICSQLGATEYFRIYFLHTDTTIRLDYADATNTIQLNATWVPTVGVWYHLSLTRNGNTYTFYVDGVSIGSTTDSDSMTDISAVFTIGAFNSTNYFNGYLDEFRVSKGIARWTANFTVPTVAYSSTSDYLSLADHADWNFGTGNFTLDKWVYFSDLTNAQNFIGQYADADNFWYFKKGTNAAGNKLQVYFRSGASDKANYIMASSSSLAINTMTHLAVVRSSSTLRIYIDGVSQTLTETTAISTNDVGDVGASLLIGQQNSTENFSGYMDEIRVSKGSALWTASFNVPTEAGTQSGTVALVTSSAAYFSASSVGKRIRAIDSDGGVIGEMTVSGYTSSTIVVGSITQDFDAFSYAAGRWGISVTTISGLSHLNSETVSVLGDGVKDSPNKVVTSGTITLTTDRFYANVGLLYTQRIKTLAQEAGSQRGTSQGKLQRINQVSLKVNNSYTGFEIGGDDDSLDAQTQISPSLYTGTIANIYYQDDYRYGSQVIIENSDPLPIELLNIISTLDTKDK